MPLFGGSKKESKDSKKAAAAQSGYPTASYPTGSYPTTQTQYGMQAQQSFAPQPPPPMGAVGQPLPGQPGYYPPPQVQGYPGYAPGQSAPAGAPPPYTPTYQPPPNPGSTTVVVKGGFDAGARFSNGGAASIPPPPPGVMPNMAQVASAQGHNVVVTQRKGDVWTGGSDGGYCIW